MAPTGVKEGAPEPHLKSSDPHEDAVFVRPEDSDSPCEEEDRSIPREEIPSNKTDVAFDKDDVQEGHSRLQVLSTKYPWLGIVFTILSSFTLALGSCFVKDLTSIHPVQLTTFRFYGMFISAAAILLCTRKSPWPGEKLFTLLLRCLFGTAALTLKYLTIRCLPLGDTSVIMATTTVLVVILARVILKEKITIVHIFLIVFTMVGVVLITKPSFIFLGEKQDADSQLGITYGFGSVVFGSFVFILMRQLKSVPYTVNILHFSVIGGVLTTLAVAMLGEFKMPQTPLEAVKILGMVSCDVSSKYLFTLALQITKASDVSLGMRSEICFSFLWQITIFQEYPDILSVTGAVIVLLCVATMGVSHIFHKLPKSCIF